MSYFLLIRNRLALLLLVVLGVTLVTFTLSHLIPGDPARLMAGDRASAETIEHMRREMGLHLPLWQQYLNYLGGLLQGDLGTSLRTQRPVLEDVLRFMPATIELAAFALLISTLLGVPLGVLSAVAKDSWIDHFARLISVTGISVPAFWLGLLVIFIFYGQLGWLPGSGRIGMDVTAPPQVTGLLTVDALLAGNFAAFGSALRHLLLPAATLGFVHLGVVTRQVRAAMLDVLSQDYIRTARASGLARWRIFGVYALKNAMIPTVTVLGLAFGDLLYGAVLTETIFAWPGMGNYALESVSALDFPAIMGFTVVASAIYVLVTLAVDLSYLMLDPQIKGVH